MYSQSLNVLPSLYLIQTGYTIVCILYTSPKSKKKNRGMHLVLILCSFGYVYCTFSVFKNYFGFREVLFIYFIRNES